MKAFPLLLLLASVPALADLYRWVDPETGSVKFSSVPPPGSQAGVEVVPYRGSAAPAKPAAPAYAGVELRWRERLGEISGAPPGSALLLQRLLRVEK